VNRELYQHNLGLYVSKSIKHNINIMYIKFQILNSAYIVNKTEETLFPASCEVKNDKTSKHSNRTITTLNAIP